MAQKTAMYQEQNGIYITYKPFCIFIHYIANYVGLSFPRDYIVIQCGAIITRPIFSQIFRNDIPQLAHDFPVTSWWRDDVIKWKHFPR